MGSGTVLCPCTCVRALGRSTRCPHGSASGTFPSGRFGSVKRLPVGLGLALGLAGTCWPGLSLNTQVRVQICPKERRARAVPAAGSGSGCSHAAPGQCPLWVTAQTGLLKPVLTTSLLELLLPERNNKNTYSGEDFINDFSDFYFKTKPHGESRLFHGPHRRGRGRQGLQSEMGQSSASRVNDM